MANEKESETKYVPRSNNSIYQPFGGWHGFMQSYGLKPWDLDDVEEGRRIVEAMKEMDKRDWEEEKAAKAKVNEK